MKQQMKALTDNQYWSGIYARHADSAELSLEGFRNRPDYLIAQTIEQIGLLGKTVLEIGAGDSKWLTYFAKKYPSSSFSGIDYSELGCARLAERARRSGVAVSVFQEDLFSANSPCHNKFDLVMSFGVVEHFSDLTATLLAKRRYLRRGGRLFTLIPNMAGVIGSLTKAYNKPIYEMHNPHGLESFVEGHSCAQLVIENAGYLCSNNFSVASSCFDKRSGLYWQTYLALTRFSKAIWFLEHHVCGLPATRYFSPYIFAISRTE